MLIYRRKKETASLQTFGTFERSGFVCGKYIQIKDFLVDFREAMNARTIIFLFHSQLASSSTISSTTTHLYFEYTFSFWPNLVFMLSKSRIWCEREASNVCITEEAIFHTQYRKCRCNRQISLNWFFDVRNSKLLECLHEMEYPATLHHFRRNNNINIAAFKSKD